ncbi:MAG TPA: N-acetyl-gamma-glutamyl-phosphate reductase [Steroidobacteraceae bacterium]|nr:N-acetyl-gamma-glutamyl-phosphate reductase [Steroidobacteraceae bacterium]
MTARVPTIVLGGTGYVAGELLRLIAGHPRLELHAVASDGQPGQPVTKFFPHLRHTWPGLEFLDHHETAALVASLEECAVLSAAPHGVSASLIDTLLARAEAEGARPRLVDISADFRYANAADYETVYRHPHGAPGRLAEFTCAVPEHRDVLPTPHAAHPGCFATAILLASVPLLSLGLVEPQLFVSGITGSTGSGRSPSAGTHHPQRHSDLYSYNALAHRHTPEVRALARAASGVDAEFAFVPHSGPFARGIHVTVQATALEPIETDALREELAGFYRNRPFVRVTADAPRIKDVATSNYAHIGVAANGPTVAVMCAIDNLVKGAAGGALQWLNRMLGFDEALGLTAPAPGWT